MWLDPVTNAKLEGRCFVGWHVWHTVDIKAHTALANQHVQKGFIIL